MRQKNAMAIGESRRKESDLVHSWCLNLRMRLWLANCYFSSHRACNVVTSFRRASAVLYLWSLILKAFATDSIFGRDRWHIRITSSFRRMED